MLKNVLKYMVPRIPPAGASEKQVYVGAPREAKVTKTSQLLLEWEAPERMFKTRPREFYRKIAVITIFVALLMFIIKEFLLILVLGVIFFVVYIFYTVPPRRVKHQITTNGVNYASQYVYTWDMLDSFFIEKRDSTDVLILNTKEALPGRVFLLLEGKATADKVLKLVNEHLSVIENPEKSFLDKVSGSISKKIKL